MYVCTRSIECIHMQATRVAEHVHTCAKESQSAYTCCTMQKTCIYLLHMSYRMCTSMYRGSLATTIVLFKSSNDNI
jgi:hypothetical protein